MGIATTRKVKEIKVNLDKCIGCRTCEMACSAFHATPKYSKVNPARSRIRVIRDELKDIYVPLRGGDYTSAECTGRHAFTIEGKVYPECCFCGVSCPTRDLFRDPESGLPLTCDMCDDLPPDSLPLCVQVCRPGALTYEERETGKGEKVPRQEMEVDLESLIIRHGVQNVLDTFTRMLKKSR